MVCVGDIKNKGITSADETMETMNAGGYSLGST